MLSTQLQKHHTRNACVICILFLLIKREESAILIYSKFIGPVVFHGSVVHGAQCPMCCHFKPAQVSNLANFLDRIAQDSHESFASHPGAFSLQPLFDAFEDHVHEIGLNGIYRAIAATNTSGKWNLKLSHWFGQFACYFATQQGQTCSNQWLATVWSCPEIVGYGVHCLPGREFILDDILHGVMYHSFAVRAQTYNWSSLHLFDVVNVSKEWCAFQWSDCVHGIGHGIFYAIAASSQGAYTPFETLSMKTDVVMKARMAMYLCAKLSDVSLQLLPTGDCADPGYHRAMDIVISGDHQRAARFAYEQCIDGFVMSLWETNELDCQLTPELCALSKQANARAQRRK